MALHATKLLLGLCTFGLLIAQSRAVDKLPSIQPSYEVPEGGAYEGLSDPRWQWWNAMRKVDRAFEWKVPLNFYGLVIDQNGLPVSHARVRFQWTDMSQNGTSEKLKQSDQTGQFSLEGEHGKSLGVWVTKDGYHSEGGLGGKSFEYAAFFEGTYHRPDPGNPVIFRLIKKLEAEPLVAHHASERVSYEKESYFDPLQGTISQQVPTRGGLKFTFQRSESPQGSPFDWMWMVEAVNGALQETNDEFAQVAPEAGYTHSWKTVQNAETKPFKANAKTQFYLRTMDNRYARVDVEIVHPNLRTKGPRITVDSFLNPSGSRILEYETKKQINPR